METKNMNLQNITLSVVIPCYNECRNIEAVVQKVLSCPVDKKEVIVVDDKSTDGSREILQEKVSPLGCKILFHEKNLGKGGALRTGFAAATGDIVIVQDADLEYDVQEIPAVIKPILEGQAKVCYGSRFLNGKAKGYFANRMANKFLTFFSNIFTGQKLTDMETCYKAFAREVIQSINIEENRFGFEPEITAKISAKKIRIAEVAISYSPRKKEEGKKIGFKDGIRAIFCIVKYAGGTKKKNEAFATISV